MIKSTNQYSLSIIIPIISEINSLKKTLRIIDKINIKKEYLIIYSKKFTPLETQKEIIRLKKIYKNLRHFSQKKPFVGGAVDLGIKKSKKEYLAIMAADLETNPHELKKMVILSKKNPNSIISADRWISEKGFLDYGLIKFLANFFFQKLIKFFFKFEILDFTFAYRIYPKKALNGYSINELRHGFALEMLLKPIKKGFEVVSIPAKWRKRVEGNSSITLQSYFSYLKVLFKNI